MGHDDSGQAPSMMGIATIDSDTDHHEPAIEGRFDGLDVRTGTGGGLASRVVPEQAVTHFRAARLPELGDTVLAVRRVFDPATSAALRIELRAFAAEAPGRGTLATASEAELLDAPGVLAYASVELAAEGDAADERRAATLRRCVVTDAAPTAAAARGIADWLRTTWEAELAFGSWPAVRGSLAAFAVEGGAPADWALEWLEAGEHRLDGAAGDTAGFLKVLSRAWLEPAGNAGSTSA